MKQFGSFTLDTVNECLWRAGVRVPLAPKPFAVLRYLVEHPGRLVSHDELLDALWPDTYVQPQVLRTYMLDLRRILDDDPRCPRYIQSLPKRGYSFVAGVCECTGSPAASGGIAQVNAQIKLPAGRESDLASLHAALLQAAGGVRQVVFVTGESGIGKTALVDAFRRQVEDAQSAVIALGQCIPGFSGQQYYPLADALRQLPDAAAISNLLNTFNNKAKHDTEQAASAPGDLCIALEEIAREKPVLLILEDLHWADESTLNILSALARRRGPARLIIVATATPHSGSTANSVDRLLHDLRMRHLCSELSLRRLGRPAVTSLVRARLQQNSLPDVLDDVVYRHSEGNPRFALALLEHLISENLLVRSGGVDSTEWQLLCPADQAENATPVDLAHAIELEIERLEAHEQQLLEAGSLALVAFPAWLVAAALGQDLDSVEEACDGLVRRLSFLKRAGEEELPDGTRSSFYVFAHALYRDVLYQRQSPARRATRHIRVAERLLAMFPGREELVARDAFTHYEAAGDWTLAIAMLRIAMRRAMEMRAFGEAAGLQQEITRIEANLPAVEPVARPDGKRDLILPSLPASAVARTSSAKA